MQPKFTQKNLGYFCTRIIAMALIFSASTQFSFAQQNPAKANKQNAVEKAQQRLKALQSGHNLNANKADNDAGILSKASTEINSPQATCTSWTVSITSGDPTITSRPNRNGVVKTCAAPGVCTNTPIAGSFNYQIFQWTNPVAQCVTVTYTATNANFTFPVVYSAPPIFGSLCTNWVSDPGSSAAVGTPIVFSFNGTAGTTYYFLVNSIAALPANCTIQIDAAVCSSTPCAGTPNPGNTTSTANPVCPTVPFTLGLQTPQNFAGITYLWEKSTTGVGGPWSPAGSTASTFTTNISVATAYRCQVTCTNSAITTISNPIPITINPPSACYCAGGATDMIDEKISRVRYASIDNSSTSQSGYENFTAISTTVIQGSILPITVNISNFFTGDLVRVWIDFNQNGSFTDPGEQVVATTNTAANPAVATITIPVTSTLGPTRMRIRMYWQPADPNPGPCGNTAYGQVEDYTVDIQPCIQGVFNTHPANASIQCGGTATFSVTTAGSLLTYGWEYKTSAASPFWLNVTNGGVYSGAATPTLTLTNVPQTYNGYVYRATIIGPCTAIDFSNAATLTVGPYQVTFNPPTTNPVTICSGTVQQISISNLVSGTATTNFTSGVISIPIPDANAAGINHTIPVALPPGALITAMSCKVNISGHTWDGDLCMVLRAPNNQRLNLDFFISGTGAGPSSPTGFVNTVLSSAGVAALSSSVSPYTGTFKADAAAASATFFGAPSGPTGFLPTTTTWPSLYSIPSGNWTLAIYDGFGGDVGTLTNWQLDITYTIPAFATGVWTASPAAPNTMFNDALATVPYVAGTPQSTIYVKPLVNTSYSVVVTTATPCVSAPGVVTVNVTNPISALVPPINRTVCVGSNASFTVSSGGGPLTYQWEVSVNNGITWSTIAGATAATLNLTAVTQLMNNNLYRVTVTAAPCGSSAPLVARLNVNQLPVVTISASTLQLVPGRIATITGTSSPAPFSATSWSWTLNGSLVATSSLNLAVNTNTLKADIDNLGTYRATVSDNQNPSCTNSSNIITIGSEASDRLWIYPNPNTGSFQVRLYYNGAIAERRMVRIYNMSGQLVAQKEFDLASGTHPYLSLPFNLGLQAAGTYAVKVVDKNGGTITSGLVVIQ